MKFPQLFLGLVGLVFMALQMLAVNYFPHVSPHYILLSGAVGLFVSAELILIGLGRGSDGKDY